MMSPMKTRNATASTIAPAPEERLMGDTLGKYPVSGPSSRCGPRTLSLFSGISPHARAAREWAAAHPEMFAEVTL